MIMVLSNAATLTSYHLMITSETDNRGHVDEYTGQYTDHDCVFFDQLSEDTTLKVMASLGSGIAFSFLLDLIWIFTLRPEI